MRSRSAAGVLGPIQTLSKADKAYPSPIAVDAGGNALIAWWQLYETNYRILARSRSAAGLLGPVLRISAGCVDGSSDCERAVSRE
jgi:hypothetical protein